jgi:hypothetical protein
MSSVKHCDRDRTSLIPSNRNRPPWHSASRPVCAGRRRVWLGWRLHGTLDQRQIYRICYGLLVVTAFKLLWDGVSGYLA